MSNKRGTENIRDKGNVKNIGKCENEVYKHEDIRVGRYEENRVYKCIREAIYI